jgi:hypothetical protein
MGEHIEKMHNIGYNTDQNNQYEGNSI